MTSFTYLIRIIIVFLSLGTSATSSTLIEPNLLLTENSNGHTVTGQSIVLNCKSSFFPNYTSIQWMVPNGVDLTSAEQEQSNSGTTDHYIITNKLTINRATKYHSGYYMCTAVHKDWPYSVPSNKLWVPVYDVDEHVIEFSKTSAFDQSEAEIRVWIRAHPHISVTWLDGDNKTVTNDSSSRFRIQTSASAGDTYFNYYTTLEFKKMSPQDFGSYTVIVDSSFEKKGQKIAVNLPWNTVKITTDVKSIDRVLKKCMYMCRIVSYPKATMYQVLAKVSADLTHPYDMSSTELEVVTPSEDNGLILVDYRFFNFSSKPTVSICGAYEGKDTTVEASGNLLLFYSENEFDIVGENITDTANRKTIEVGYGTSAKVTAVASLHSYNKEITKMYYSGRNWTSRALCDPFRRLGNRDKSLCKINIHYFVEAPTGKYKFEALSNRGEIHSKTIEIVPKRVTNLVAEATIRNLNGGHYRKGETIKLECTCTFYKHGDLRWKKNADIIRSTANVQIVETYSINNSTFITKSQLTISDAEPDNTTTYFCDFFESDRSDQLLVAQYISISVFKVNERIIEYKRNSGFFWEKAQIQVNLLVFPKPTVIQWFKDDNAVPLLDSSPRFVISNQQLQNRNNYNCTLNFKSFDVEDFGDYTIVAEIGNSNKLRQTFKINVTGEPSTKIAILKTYRQNQSSIIECKSIGYPEPTIKWYFAQCKDILSCLKEEPHFTGTEVERNESNFEKRALLLTSHLRVNSSESGLVTCRSRNQFGQHYTSELIINPAHGFELFAENMVVDEFGDNIIESIHGEELNIWCVVSVYSYRRQIQWYSSDDLEDFELVLLNTMKDDRLLSSGSVITLSVSKSTKSYYVCNALTVNDTLKTRIVQIKRRENPELYIYNSNLVRSSVHVGLGTEWSFFCHVDGFPSATVQWFKNNATIATSERIQIRNNSQVLCFKSIETVDEGSYSCRASNRLKQVEKTQTLIIATDLTWLYAILALAALVLVALATYNIFKIRKERRLLRELKLADLAYFEKGALENLNPELGIEEQAHVLPYDQKWEIPRGNIKLGKQLGSGAFGVVYAAEVGDSGNTVAVKTVDRHSGYEHVKILAGELKLMVHLGQHLNIVNLVGACTKNIVKRELLVVVEYCPFGNLHEYMLRFGKGFIDQKNYQTDQYEWIEDFCEESSNVGEAAATYSEEIAICSQDLLVWSFQITQGMAYLSSRKIVHGDLAARNILLGDNNVVKISDFGLSKQMYKDKDYFKSGQARLPVKWMAIESIRKDVFSTQSDIWSFGIVLWELFSLGDTPYPGVLPFNETFKRILGGYRMESPKAATHFVYETMLECWHVDPLQRPDFANLAERIGSLLKEQVKDHYVEMNGGYVEVNELNGDDDILMTISGRHYENTRDPYMDMKGGSCDILLSQDDRESISSSDL